MNVNQTALDTILSRKGQIVTMTTEREVKVRKGRAPIVKVSTFQARVGVNYDNLSVVKEKRTVGELPAVNQGLPWGEWETFPYVIKHKDERYVRCSVFNGNKGSAHYFRNGKEISMLEVQADCLASELSEKSGDVFNVKVSSIRTVK